MSESNSFLINELIGQKIRKYRKFRGMNLSALSSKLGVSAQQLQKYETGQNRISANKILEISRVLDVPILKFFSFEDNTYASNLGEDVNLKELIDNYNLIRSEKLKNLLVYSSKLYSKLNGEY